MVDADFSGFKIPTKCEGLLKRGLLKTKKRDNVSVIP